ncbi:MAG: 2-amino-4-hydroxy-6-hydroxymethyldihydropteridine diphosphokinase [Deltaproteobacteria bacterium]|nr:2-amino-4-hydroxy-6-hydroxymethyldihydropteridine diphosphokinase [Deltaproteobacteria bacterium]MBW1925276.1 2-amino-4-hydroxy-6-hydroxymethyldihydropteridine diphosphokinase [Deltaproteobacteria bacterium]MBW1950799.1 2-amino-4-hydroxy-6-hydroxymethyldihydropteridine diphosphokinase [Deltaproteobacteria bacterium]MBW2008981.1 2-amino-4-hydroxy-6-hydroxymethyldihydropteridine diphosphokinase [Deltaproteobacteria bacterium]MBW2102854.1 2-amino-4-hydroxy-6-hydroxymethyldihydropteridine diphos
METAYIGVGSNLGDREENCLGAVDRMVRMPACRVTGRADLFQTEPVGVRDQDWFVNTVVRLDTALDAKTLLKGLLRIETDMGRVRRKRWDARTIDLDILLFGERTIDEPDLRVPHPLLHERRFVLVPLVQLAPELRHPVLGASMRELLARLPEKGQAVTVYKTG